MEEDEIPSDPITLTDKAVEMIIKVRADEHVPDERALRLAVKGGGCSGYSYDLYFDAPRPGMDMVYMIKGVKVVIDQMSLMYLMGTEIDYVESLMGGGFKFNNPNVKATCGCGSSFTV